MLSSVIRLIVSSEEWALIKECIWAYLALPAIETQPSFFSEASAATLT
jgi:hypothetical protein